MPGEERLVGHKMRGTGSFPGGKAFQGMSPKHPLCVGKLSPLWKGPAEPGWRDQFQGSEEDPVEQAGCRAAPTSASANST